MTGNVGFNGPRGSQVGHSSFYASGASVVNNSIACLMDWQTLLRALTVACVVEQLSLGFY